MVAANDHPTTVVVDKDDDRLLDAATPREDMGASVLLSTNSLEIISKYIIDLSNVQVFSFTFQRITRVDGTFNELHAILRHITFQ